VQAEYLHNDLALVDYDDESISDSPDSDGESQSPSGTLVCASLHT